MSNKLSKCRYCGQQPNFFNISGGWNITCDCFFCSMSSNAFFSDWEDAVNHWNTNYGENQFTHVTTVEDTNVMPACTCSNRELMWYGCRCSFAKWKANKDRIKGL